MEKTPIKFYKFRETDMLNTFGIRRISECHQLQYWLDTTGVLDDFETKTLSLALTRHAKMGNGWNEEELKMHFISAIFSVADLSIEGICHTFFERPLDGIIQNYQIHVVSDCMLASPRLGGDPDKPYFFLQEFKQAQRFGRTDPQGQMLAAMLPAQEKNTDNRYLYGCYVIERHWYFTTLLDRNYCVSPFFDATKETDLYQIIFILRKLKEMIVSANRINSIGNHD